MTIDTVVQAAVAYHNLDKQIRGFHEKNPHIKDKPGLAVLVRLRERLEEEIIAYRDGSKAYVKYRENACHNKNEE